jgi:superfamily II DNA or RNA helicase
MRSDRASDSSGQSFLLEKLKGAISYERIAGYFDSSLFEFAGEALERVNGPIRIVCNSDIKARDIAAAGPGVEQAQKLSFFKNDPEIMSKRGAERLNRLYSLLSGTGQRKIDVRVLPDEAFGLIHGKAGVIRYADGRSTSFLGSANETFSGWSLNYELVWEDDSEEACSWVSNEFARLWQHALAVPLSNAVISEVERLSKRVELDLSAWRDESSHPLEISAASIVVESPVYRREFGLWPHQKYFVQTAWRAHKAFGARFVLADQVGLGKTVQLGMSAQLMALSSEKPVLAILPKTLLLQWQTELWDLLAVPSARWDGKQWIDECGLAYPNEGRNPLLFCPRRIGLISQGLVVHGSDMVDALAEIEWECILVDEAHRARRKKLPGPDDRGPLLNNPVTEANKLYAFLWRLARKTRSMLLATATPVQMHPIEAWDLLRLLAEGNEHVLGGIGSRWMHPETALPLVLGELPIPEEPAEVWPWLKNPLPPSWEAPNIKSLRKRLNLKEDQAVAGISFDAMPATTRVTATGIGSALFDSYTPFLRTIVRRTRSYLENTTDPDTREPYLKRIELELFGEDDPVPLRGYLAQAYEAAEEFCRLLNKRVKSAGFFKTILLRRIGSSMNAGLSTVNKLLSNWDRLPEFEDDEESEEDGGFSNTANGLLRTLTTSEESKLIECQRALETNKDDDPKLHLILRYLRDEGWAGDGCILFSQYYDTASWVAKNLVKAFPNNTVAVYAGAGKSGIYEGGCFLRRERDEIKRLVKEGDVTLLVGTDAASEGLNLQSLGTLINVDLPWNPTRLEQRKGRIQRIGQSRDKVRILNLRYAGSVEDKVHAALSGRLEQIRNLFGQIPDVLEDLWIEVALGEIEEAERRLESLPKKHAFDDRYGKIENVPGWEDCAQVLNAHEKMEALRRGWKD